MWKSMTALIILSFCLGSAAWLIFMLATRRGRFDDGEDAKYRMLEDDDEPIQPRRDESRKDNGKQGGDD